jgi:aldose 1-epimerase
VTYSLDGNALRINYDASCDKDTVVNFTNHAYFNLNGGGTILDHLLWLDADEYLPIDDTSIPFGAPESVDGTPFDFRVATAIGARIDAPHPQLVAGSGYDHNFIIKGEGMRKAANLSSAETGISMDVYTDMPGIQVYSGNFMDSPAPLMRGGKKQEKRTAICLETQLYPDSPNHPEYPSCVLKAGERFTSETKYIFS